MSDQQPTISPCRPDRWKPLMPRVAARILVTEDGCWQWDRPSHPKGYGKIHYQGKSWLAHRAVYTELVGPIPENLEIDHLCENKGCVNPEHLEAVPRIVNLMRSDRGFTSNARKTHCPKGHEYAPENTHSYYQEGKKTWARFCRTCRAQWAQDNRDRQNELRRARRARGQHA